ncbi:MAG: twin-arginine translocation signal domain-containing protein [Caldilineaceae bacterium]
MESLTHGRLSRRSFLKLSAATATLSTLAACVPAGVAPSGGTGSNPGTEPIVINHMSRADFEAQRLAIETWNQENPGVQIKMDEVVGDT